MKIVKAVGALAVLAVLLLGVPAALLAWGQPWALFRASWPDALLRPDDGRVLLSLLTWAGWLAWLLLAGTAIGELLALVSQGRVSIRLPGTGWLRPTMASLAAATLAPVLAPNPLVADAPSASPLLARAAADPGPAAGEDPPESRPASAGPESKALPGVELVEYLVQPGDELWTLAERVLGAGERWREIVAANPGMGHQDQLVAGTVIRLPAGGAERPAKPAPGEDAPEGRRVITVAEGDTLWDLAEEHLGDPERWPEIHDANRDQIADPDQIDIGWRLVLPAAGLAAQVPVESVKEGDDPDTEQPAAPVPVSDPLPAPGSIGADAPEAVPNQGAPKEELEAPPTIASDATEPGDHATLPADPRETEAPVREPVQTHRPPLRLADSPAQRIVGPMGAVLAAGVVAVVAARLRAQRLRRPIGQRALPASPELQRFWASLGRVQEERPAPMDSPTDVALGWSEDEPVALDLEAVRCTLVQSATAADGEAAVAAIITSLACAGWSATTELVVVESPEDWVQAFDEPRIGAIADLQTALADLQRLCAGRRLELGSGTLSGARTHPDVADAWAPVVFLFSKPLPAEALDRIRDCLALGEVGVSVVARTEADAVPDPGWKVLRLDDAEHALLLPDGVRLQPQLVTAPARRAIVELLATASSTDTEPAPWWEDHRLPPNVKVLPCTTNDPVEDRAMSPWPAEPVAHPTLLLLGPVELVGCTGIEPSRSRASAMEICAWLLQHPGATPTRMLQDMVIAETTRRSNLSRLRSWLGSDPDKAPYLPDAYSGTLELHPDVTSDWEHFQLLLSGGVTNASTAALTEALGIIRGEPLAGVWFQWPWAEQLRSDMLAMITDTAVVLFERALQSGDLGTARWALRQGRLAVGADEALAVREIQLLAMRQDRRALDQAIRRLTRTARAEGRDLEPDSVNRIQEALQAVLTGQSAT